MGPGSGARRTATPPGVHRTRESPVVRVRPRPAGILPMPVETNAPHTCKNSQKKPCRSTHAPAGLRGLDPRVCWRGPAERHLQPGGKNVLSVGSSICGNLTGTPADARGLLSGTAMRVPKKPRESCLKPAKNAKRKTNLGPNARCTHNAIHAAVAPVAHRSGPAKRPLERGPPPSRAHAASNEVRLAQGITPPLKQGPPRSRVPASLERGPPRSRFPHERTCSCTRVLAFNALTQQSRATTRLGITPRRYFANSLGEAHSHHCGELCDEAGVSSVTLCRPLLYG
jgi:hypothetical protein